MASYFAANVRHPPIEEITNRAPHQINRKKTGNKRTRYIKGKSVMAQSPFFIRENLAPASSGNPNARKNLSKGAGVLDPFTKPN
jgi:hypothetical protein